MSSNSIKKKIIKILNSHTFDAKGQRSIFKVHMDFTFTFDPYSTALKLSDLIFGTNVHLNKVQKLTQVMMIFTEGQGHKTMSNVKNFLKSNQWTI